MKSPKITEIRTFHLAGIRGRRSNSPATGVTLMHNSFIFTSGMRIVASGHSGTGVLMENHVDVNVILRAKKYSLHLSSSRSRPSFNPDVNVKVSIARLWELVKNRGAYLS